MRHWRAGCDRKTHARFGKGPKEKGQKWHLAGGLLHSLSGSRERGGETYSPEGGPGAPPRLHISHVHIDQRLGNFPARRQIQAWLKAGYLEHGQFFSTTEGTPQGAICSPLVANVALDGLADLLANRFPDPGRRTRPYFGYIRYADDLVVTSPDKDRLEAAIPVIQEWLAGRGLELNADKTRIVQIDDGFNFLGFHLRRYKGTLLIKPQKAKVLAKLTEIRAWLREHLHAKQEEVIAHLNQTLRGWSLYYRHVVSSQVYTYVDHRLFRMLWTWARRRHPRKPAKWIKAKYFHAIGTRKWV